MYFDPGYAYGYPYPYYGYPYPFAYGPVAVGVSAPGDYVEQAPTTTDGGTGSQPAGYWYYGNNPGLLSERQSLPCWLAEGVAQTVR